MLPFKVRLRKESTALCASLAVLVLVTGALYLVLQDSYVTSTQLPTAKAREVVHGSKLPSLVEPYASMSDDDLTRNVGFSDAELRHAYTPASLIRNRLTLFSVYVLCLSAFEYALGCFARNSSRAAAATRPRSSA